ncbi:MAG: KH domain-containing protein [Armatimonadaceae bacterium]
MKSTVEFLVKELVDNPDAVEVSEITGDDSTTYEVRVSPDDLGKVIGKQGRIANAIRTLVKAVAMKDKRKVYVEILA